MEIELVPGAEAAEREAVTRAIAVAMDAKRFTSPWWRARLDKTLGRAPVGPPLPSDYEAVRSPRRTRGATRA